MARSSRRRSTRRPRGVHKHKRRSARRIQQFMTKALRRLLLNDETNFSAKMRDRIENLFEWDSSKGNMQRALTLLKHIAPRQLRRTALVNTRTTTYPYMVSPRAAKLLNALPLSPSFEFTPVMTDFLDSVDLSPVDVKNDILHCFKSTPQHTHPALVMGIVPEEDAREALRGQLAVYSNTLIPRGTYLGTYSGALTTTAEYDTWYPNESVGHAMHSIYALTADDGEMVPGADDKDNELSIYPLGGTDLLHMVNDARVDPFHKNNALRHQKEGENAGFIAFRWMKGLYMGLVALKDIPLGEEVKIDYGDAYWDDKQ